MNNEKLIVNPTLVCMMGLPRSGKSTIARKLSQQYGAPIVDTDSIRLAMYEQAFIKKMEQLVWPTAKIMVEALFLAGHGTVILDATNCTTKERMTWKSTEWITRFHEVPTNSAECKARAIATNQDYLLPVIDRMEASYQLINEEEEKFWKHWNRRCTTCGCQSSVRPLNRNSDQEVWYCDDHSDFLDEYKQYLKDHPNG